MLVSGSLVFCPAVPFGPQFRLNLEVFQAEAFFSDIIRLTALGELPVGVKPSHPRPVRKNAIRSYMPSEVEFQPPLRNPSVLSIRLENLSEGFGNEKLTR